MKKVCLLILVSCILNISICGIKSSADDGIIDFGSFLISDEQEYRDYKEFVREKGVILDTLPYDAFRSFGEFVAYIGGDGISYQIKDYSGAVMEINIKSSVYNPERGGKNLRPAQDITTETIPRGLAYFDIENPKYLTQYRLHFGDLTYVYNYTKELAYICFTYNDFAIHIGEAKDSPYPHYPRTTESLWGRLLNRETALEAYNQIISELQAYTASLPHEITVSADSLQEFTNQYKNDSEEKVQNFCKELKWKGFPEFTYNGDPLPCTYKIGVNLNSDECYFRPQLKSPLEDRNVKPRIRITYSETKNGLSLAEKYPGDLQQIQINLNGGVVDAYLQKDDEKIKNLIFFDQAGHEIRILNFSHSSEEDFLTEVERYRIIYHHGQSFYIVLFCSIGGVVLLTGGILAFVLVRKRKKCSLLKNPVSSAAEEAE